MCLNIKPEKISSPKGWEAILKTTKNARSRRNNRIPKIQETSFLAFEASQGKAKSPAMTGASPRQRAIFGK